MSADCSKSGGIVPTAGLIACMLMVSGGTSALADGQFIEFGSSMRYLENVSDPGIGMSWTTPDFDDSGWADGSYGVGYETGSGAESLILTNVSGESLSIYTRATFSVGNLDNLGKLLIGADYDDGWVAWINGVEVFRSPEMPAGPLAWDTAPDPHESSNAPSPVYEPLHDITDDALPLLHDGDNLLAVGVWNVGPPEHPVSSDLVVVPLLANQEVSWRAPYLQIATPTSTIVRWRTATLTESALYYGAEPGDLKDLGTSIVDPVLTTEHSIEIAGLSPETRYYYAVGTTSEILAGDDEDHFFETHPLPGPPRNTRIWVLGDSGVPGPNQQAVRDSYLALAGDRYTDVWLHVGDISQTTGTDPQYQVEFFEAYTEIMRQTAFWPTIGNHDGYSADSTQEVGPYYENFTLPTAGEAGGLPSGTEAYYSFDYANIHFVNLNSQDIDRSPGGEMLTWLEADLGDTTADWIIVYWHHPPYSKGSHDSDDPGDSGGRLVDMRENVLPILDDYGVDLVLSGHSHSYERSLLLDGHYGDSQTLVESMKVDDGDGREDGDGPYEKLIRGPVPYPGPGDGVVYVVAGSSGQTESAPLNHPVMPFSFEQLGSLVLDIDGLRLDARFLDDTCTESPCPESVMDYFTIVKGCPSGDDDGDGVCDDRDNCLGLSNPDQADDDADDVGNPCDPCPEDPVNDPDEDTLCAVDDNCPLVPNPDQLDTDGDGAGDACDLDDDNDGVEDPDDCAPLIVGVSRSPESVGATLRLDRFGGTTLYWRPAPQGHVSNVYGALVESGSPVEGASCMASTTGKSHHAPQLPPPGLLMVYLVNGENVCGPGSLGQSSDGTERSAGTLCSPSPTDDFDFDGIVDLADNCSQWPNPQQKDVDLDFVGNACDNCNSVPNPDQADCDEDGQGDLCDSGSDCDGDGLANPSDNCPYDENPLQEDADGDLIGDACDPCVDDADNDADADGVCGDVDNCPGTANPEQTDTDVDLLGDACDPDDDNDGVDDEDDCAPLLRGVSEPPDVIGATLRLSKNGTTELRWLRSYQGHTSNVYAGSQADGQVPSFGLECLASEVPETEAQDEAGSPVGTLTYYLISARNACGESEAGSYGSGPPPPLEETCPDLGQDSDGDGAPDLADNCPLEGNPQQFDADADFVGDACDNCPETFNPDQADTDADGTGDACDPA